MKIQKTILTSRQNATVKRVASLHDKKGRRACRAFVAEGEKLTFEAAEAGLPITHVFVSDKRFDSLSTRISEAFSSAAYADTEIITVTEEVFEKISTEKAPQGIISVIKHLDFFKELDIIYKEDFFLKDDERAIALCSVRDPGNIGSVIRSAVAFGAQHIVLSADSADIYNSKTVRSAMGALFKVKVTVVRDFASFISAAQANGRNVYAAELTDNAVALDQIKALPTDIFIIGNEGHGIPAEISSACNNSVYIPISSNTESLNASVAAAIFMWEQGKK